MSWWNPFKKTEEPAGAATEEKKSAPESAELETPEAKGLMAQFYRKWKDPSFLKQLRTLAAHMQKEGVNVKDMAAVKAWLEKNKDAIEAGKFDAAPASGENPKTFVKTGPDVGRNDPCTCGSGKKYKKCCAAKAA